jgi:2-isopropylmalate synthase
MQMEVDREIVQDAGFGVGPVDATFDAIRKITGTNYDLLRYVVNASSGGTDAQGEVTVQLQFNGRSVVGHGADLDVIVASARAYINALNRSSSSSGMPARSNRNTNRQIVKLELIRILRYREKPVPIPFQSALRVGFVIVRALRSSLIWN